MTATDSFSSDINPADPLRVDLLATGRFPPLVEAFLKGDDLDLLRPVRFLAGGELPTGDCAATEMERQTIAEALAAANTARGHSNAAQLAGQLADPSTRVVITGQQPGLFGGPLYTLSKAIAAQLWAERLEAAGQPAVALFWMATEDHDFRESSQVSVLSAKGVRAVGLGEDEEPLVPVGRRALGPQVESALAEMQEAVPGDRYGEWLRQLAKWYTPEAHFGEAFARLMTFMLGDRCPLLVDAMLPALKTAEKPWMQKLVERRGELEKAFADRDQEIVDRGYPLQVKPQPGSSPLFLEHRKQRRRIEWRGNDRFGLRGDDEFEESIEQLTLTLEEEPARVSPGVRARSAIQDAVFGTCLQILGPGEVSYMPQAAPLFEVLEIPAPMVALRPQVLILDSRQRARIVDSGMSLSTLLQPDLDLDHWLARPEDTAFMDAAVEQVETILQRLQASSLALDEGLERPLEKTGDQMRRALVAFGSRVTAAAARREDVLRNRLLGLRDLCLPEGRLQERVIASSHFPGKHGDAFVEALFDQMKLEPTTLHVVTP